jgi:hypothetical protein
MAQIDGKFLVDGYEAATRVVDFLSKTNRISGCVHFFDVPSAPTGTAHKFAKITSATIRQLFPRFEFSFVLAREAIAGEATTRSAADTAATTASRR